MKYLKTYEAKRNKGLPYKSPSNKRKEAINSSNKYKEFIPGSYIAFRWYYSNSYDFVILARIIKIKEVRDSEAWNYQSVTYLDTQVLDTVEIENNLGFDLSKNTDFHMKYINKYYISTSLKNIEEKYKELIEEAQMEKNMNKYNL